MNKALTGTFLKPHYIIFMMMIFIIFMMMHVNFNNDSDFFLNFKQF